MNAFLPVFWQVTLTPCSLMLPTISFTCLYFCRDLFQLTSPHVRQIFPNTILHPGLNAAQDDWLGGLKICKQTRALCNAREVAVLLRSPVCRILWPLVVRYEITAHSLPLTSLKTPMFNLSILSYCRNMAVKINCFICRHERLDLRLQTQRFLVSVDNALKKMWLLILFSC